METKLTVIEFTKKDLYFLYLEKLASPGMTKNRWHAHAFYEIMYFAEGELEYVIENKKYIAKRGDVLFIKPGCHHFERRIIKSPCIICCLGFSHDKIENTSDIENLFALGEHFNVGDSSAIADIFQLARKKLEKSKSNGEVFLKNIAEITILSLIDQKFEAPQDDTSVSDNVKRIIKYVNKNLSDIRTINDIIKPLFLSASYARDTFKKEMGIAIMEYVRNKKIILAHQMIKRGKKPTEIYTECGFSNYSTFYRAYRAYFGCAPRHKNK